MRIELLKNLLTEEIRLHTTLYNKKNFFAFPIAILILTTFIATSILQFSDYVLNMEMIALYSTFFFFISGIMSGTIGLNASNYLERRFGDYGKLFRNANILPIKLSDIFMTSAISDSIFYLGWLIIPIILGFTCSLIISGNLISLIPLLFISSMHAFIIGILLSFFLTVLFVKSRIRLFSLLAIITAFFLYNKGILDITIFPSYRLFSNFTILTILECIIWIIILYFLCKITVGREYHTKIKAQKKTASYAIKKYPFLKKDWIDLKRTHGLIAKPLFNVFIPSVLLMILLGNLSRLNVGITTTTTTLIFFSVIVGTLSISFQNSLISGDSMNYYSFLPVSLSKYMDSKFLLSACICFIQGTILIVLFSILKKDISFIFQSFSLLLSFILYSSSISFFVTGLQPNENSLSAPNLIKMSLFMVPVLIIGMVIPSLFPNMPIVFITFLIISITLSKIIYSKGIKKWEHTLTS